MQHHFPPTGCSAPKKGFLPVLALGSEPITSFINCHLFPKRAPHSPRTKPQWPGLAHTPTTKPVTVAWQWRLLGGHHGSPGHPESPQTGCGGRWRLRGKLRCFYQKKEGCRAGKNNTVYSVVQIQCEHFKLGTKNDNYRLLSASTPSLRLYCILVAQYWENPDSQREWLQIVTFFF